MRDEKILLREMNVDDISKVYNLGKVAFIGEKSNESPYVYSFWTLKSLVSFIENYTDMAFVALNNNEIVGFVLGHPNYVNLQNIGWIEWLAVKEEFRKKGIAKLLIKKIIESYKNKGIKRMVTEIKSINKASIDLFSKNFNFKEVESISFFEKDLI